jgi:hypothetical protein
MLYQKGHEGYFKGKKFSEEHKKNLSLAQRGRKKTPEAIEKNRLSHIGKHPSLETRKKLGDSHRVGIRHIGGRVFIYRPDHPFCNSRKYVRQARIVMEDFLKRLLTSVEVVHHINGVVSDDRIDNLKLFPNNREHRKFHKQPKNNVGRFTHLTAS